MGFALGLLAQGLSLGFAAAVSPGPFLAYVISETLSRGWRHSFPLIIVPLLSDGPIIVLTVLILGQVPAWTLSVIQIIGGLFVLYLAWGMFRQLRQNVAISLVSDDAPQPRHVLLHGTAIALFNPGPWIFWSTVNAPIVIKAWQQSHVAALAFMIGFYSLLLGGLAGWIAVFHLARRLDERIVRGLLAASAVVMTIFGLLLLKSGIFP